MVRAYFRLQASEPCNVRLQVSNELLLGDVPEGTRLRYAG